MIFYKGLLARIKRVKPAEPESICKDCGIDLPSTWHWDGCTQDRARSKRK